MSRGAGHPWRRAVPVALVAGSAGRAARALADQLAVHEQRENDLAALARQEAEALRIDVTGPRQGPNGPTYDVATTNRDRQPVAANLDAVLRDANGVADEL